MISTNIIAHAIKHYSGLKYVSIDVPLVVDLDVIEYTKPKDRSALLHPNGKAFVGSAEQSFLQLIKNGMIFPNKVFAITPCHRDESPNTRPDEIYEIFLKGELFIQHPCYEMLMDDAYHFFKSYTKIEIIETDIGHDIIHSKSGIELGSYGKRTVIINGDKVTYSYGTGFAEPRLSYCLSLD